MKKPETWRLVLAYLQPNKTSFEAHDWRSYVSKHLLPEIGYENARYYGNAEGNEIRQPGLDYASPSHRSRLAAFPRHQQLFAVLDRLRLTNAEIQAFCSWDGTRTAKESWERRHKQKIRDTTWDGVNDFQKPPPTVTVMPQGQELEQAEPAIDQVQDEEDTEDELLEDTSEDEVVQSVGLSLNRRLLAAAAARGRGENVDMDPDWEQWIKELMERGLVTENFLQNLQPGTNRIQPQPLSDQYVATSALPTMHLDSDRAPGSSLTAYSSNNSNRQNQSNINTNLIQPDVIGNRRSQGLSPMAATLNGGSVALYEQLADSDSTDDTSRAHTSSQVDSIRRIDELERRVQSLANFSTSLPHFPSARTVAATASRSQPVTSTTIVPS